LSLKPVILVADDELGVRESFEVLLGKDYDLLFATTGREVLEILKNKNVNLVLLDIRMPEMDGIEALRQIKELNEDTDVIIVTAVKTLKTAVEAIKLGAYD